MSRHSSPRIDLKCASLSFLRHTKTYLFDFLSAVVNETSYFFFWALANKHQVSGLLMLLFTAIKNQVLDCKHLSAFPTWKGGLTIQEATIDIGLKCRYILILDTKCPHQTPFSTYRGPLLILFMETYYEKYLFNLWPEKESGCNCSVTSTVIGWKLITTLISSNHSSFL